MDSAPSSANTSPSRADTSVRSSQQRSSAATSTEKKQTATQERQPADKSVTVKGRFDPDLRRFFVTILDTSSQTLITQFPSQAVARYVQQLKKAAADGDPPSQNADSTNAQEQPKLDRTT